ncbi:MAG: aspartate/glutamate racemase family protein [Gammaproteobacteria bacterium]
MRSRETVIGFLMLETRFPRIVGDAGCAATWHFPVIYETVPGASPARTVRGRARGLLPAFVRAGQKLVARGAAGIATTCGFLSLRQRELSAALPAPVLSGALLSGRRMQDSLPPGKKLGILTASTGDLSAAHLDAAGIDGARAVVGGPPPDSAFAAAFLRNRPQLNIDRARAEMVVAARELCGRGNIGALLLECANMPPYAAAVEAAVGVQTRSLIDAVADFRQTLP